MSKGPRLLTALASGNAKPIGYLPNGRAIWPVRGGSSDDDSNASWSKDKTDSDEDDEEDSDKDKSEDDNKEDEKSDSDKESKKSDAISREDYEALKRRMQAADRNAATIAAKLKEYEDKDKTDLQRASEERDSLKEENETLKEAISKLRISNAFLASNTYTWHDPEDALNALDVDSITIDDDGKVDKKTLKAAIKAVAEAKPHWIKTEVKDSGEPGPGRSNNNDDSKKKRSELLKKYPALGNR